MILGLRVLLLWTGVLLFGNVRATPQPNDSWDCTRVISEGRYRSNVTLNASPSARQAAGKYAEVRGVSDWKECARKCCAHEHSEDVCHVAYFVSEICYLVTCVSDEACTPTPVGDTDAGTSVIVSMRSVVQQRQPLLDKAKDEPSTDHPIDPPEKHTAGISKEGHLSPTDIPCELELFGDCHVGEKCVERLGTSGRSRQGVCRCVQGLARSSAGRCVKDTGTKDPQATDFETKEVLDEIDSSKTEDEKAGIKNQQAANSNLGPLELPPVSPDSIRVAHVLHPTVSPPKHPTPTPPAPIPGLSSKTLVNESNIQKNDNSSKSKLSDSTSSTVDAPSELNSSTSVPEITGVLPETSHENNTSREKPAGLTGDSGSFVGNDGNETVPVLSDSPVPSNMPNVSATVSGISTATTADDTTTAANNRNETEVKSGLPHDSEDGGKGNESTIKANGRNVTIADGSAAADTTIKSSENTQLVSTQLITAATTTTTTTSTPIEKLAVSAGGNRKLQLPQQNGIELSAFAVPAPENNEVYTYQWTLSSAPGDRESAGVIAGIHDSTLALSQLVSGEYILKIAVTGPHKYGEGFVNVTVLSPPRPKVKPVAVISPKDQTVKEGETVLLNGQGSYNPGGSGESEPIKSFQWEILKAPISEGTHLANPGADIVKISHLSPGQYVLKLTVTNGDGQTNSTTADVHVEPEKNYAPTADAGADALVKVPPSTIILNGNKSHDDKGIVSYKWTQITSLVASMDEATNVMVQVKDLQEGDYTFELEVTDSAGQTDTDQVHIFVTQSNNNPPVARVASKKLQITSPVSEALLDGTLSTDDGGIEKYMWTCTSGQSDVDVKPGKVKGQSTAQSLKPGEYTFSLTVEDGEGLKDSKSVTVKVLEEPNEPPVANAGPDVNITLPAGTVLLNGSRSHDDRGIVSYKWARHDSSPAAGEILGKSGGEPILRLGGLVSGHYRFTLTVEDKQGLQSSDSVKLHVAKDNISENVLVMTLEREVELFTVTDKLRLEALMLVMLSEKGVCRDPLLKVRSIQGDSSGRVEVSFIVYETLAKKISDDPKDDSNNEPGVKDSTADAKPVVRRLCDIDQVIGVLLGEKEGEVHKKGTVHSLGPYSVRDVRTPHCRNTCSAHGSCDNDTRLCVCDSFWMHDFIAFRKTGHSNCDWNIVYVVLTVLSSLFGVAMICWFCTCYIKRLKNPRKRKARYQLLSEFDCLDSKSSSKKRLDLKELVLSSASDLTSDEDTLFVNTRLSQQAQVNGGTAVNRGSGRRINM